MKFYKQLISLIAVLIVISATCIYAYGAATETGAKIFSSYVVPYNVLFLLSALFVSGLLYAAQYQRWFAQRVIDKNFRTAYILGVLLALYAVLHSAMLFTAGTYEVTPILRIIAVCFGYIIIGCFAYVLGERIWSLITETDIPIVEQGSIYITTGLGSMMIISFLLVATGFFSVWTVGIILLVAIGAFYKRYIDLARRIYAHTIQIKKQSYLNMLSVTTVILWLQLTVMSITTTVIDADSLRAYFNIPMLIVQYGSFIEFPYYIFNNAIHAGSYLYAPLLLVGESFLQYVNIFLLMLLAISMYLVGKRIWSKSASQLGILLFLAMPLQFWMVTTLKFDYLQLLFLCTALLVLLISRQQKIRYGMAGAFVGIALLIKLSGAFLIPCMFVVLILFPRPDSLREVVKNFFYFGVGGIIVVTPFLINHYIHFGSILYPFVLNFNSRFVATYVSGYEQINYILFDRAFRLYSHGLFYTNPWFVNLWNLIVVRQYYPLNAIGLSGSIVLMLSFLSLFLKRTIYAGIFIVGTFIIWYWVNLSQLWYILFIFAIGSLVAGYIVSRYGGVVRNLTIYIVLLVMTIMFDGSRLLAASTSVTNQFIASSDQSPTAIFLNTRLQETSPSYLLYPLSRGMPNLGRINDNHKHIFFDDGQFAKENTYVSQYSAERLLSIFEEIGITHVYYDYETADFFKDAFCNYDVTGTCFPGQAHSNFEVLEPFLVPVYSHEAETIYEIRYPN